ncbi:MAG: hypothetical protein AAF773_00860 [Cyanobacteria bacterium P01_D01_bin.115]
MEIILYRDGKMPVLFVSKNSANTAIASGQYQKSPLTGSVASKAPSVELQAPPAEESWEIAPNESSLNVNTATLSELEGLEGVGLTIGRRLIEQRPLRVVEDAIAVSNRPDWQGLYDKQLIYFGAPE